jgi:tight adherence protein C
MIAILLVTALLAIPAGVLIVIGDDTDGLEQVRRYVRSSAKNSQDRTHLRTRLAELGRGAEKDYVAFRIKQYGYCASGSALSFVVTQTILNTFLLSLFVSILILAAIAFLMDRELSRDIKNRRELIESEFPAIIEMLTLSIAAGETPMSAIVRIADSADGQLSREFQIVVADVRAGVSLNETLDAMGRRVKSVMIRRFVDALVTATMRGAPLVEVLSRHAVEARANQRNRVMGAAGKAEISMMIPVVFLILPISILFALWPSLTNLNMFAR